MNAMHWVRPRASTALAAAVAACIAQTSLGAPAPLADAELDAVTAGGPQASAPADGRRPAVIVADGAQYTLNQNQSVLLQGDAQAGIRALNVVDVAGSDVGNAVNVLSRETAVGDALQLNTFEQREIQSGSLGRASLAGENVTRRSSIERSTASGGSSSSVTGWESRTFSRTSTVDQFSAFVPEYNPLQNLTLTVGTPALDPLRIPSFEVDFVEETDVGNYGIRGGVGPFTLGAPQLVLGSISLDGDDVVLSSGYVQVPSLDLGSAHLQVCVVACTPDVSVDLGGFTGPRVDLPGGDLRFEGANPFKDTHLNAGHGFAVAGAGSISVVPGHVTLGAELTLDLPDPSFSFDFTIPGIGEIGPWSVDGPNIGIEIPAISVSHNFIDQDVGVAYSASFDGALCIALETSNCASSSRQTEHQESRAEAELYQVTATSYSHSTGSRHEELDVHVGATLSNAEAELIAMSQGSAHIDSLNSVALSDSAQSGLQALNAVNAADAIIGNALNVSAVRPTSITSGNVAGSLGQSNVFVQHRTQYGR